MYVFTLWLSRGIVRFLLYGASRATWGKSVKRLCGDCTEIVQCQCRCTVSAASTQKSYGARAGIGLRTVPVRGLCNATYEMSMGYGLTIFSNLSNFSRNQIVEAAEPVNPYENLTAASCLHREASRRPHGKGDTGSVDQSQAKCELGMRCDKKLPLPEPKARVMVISITSRQEIYHFIGSHLLVVLYHPFDNTKNDILLKSNKQNCENLCGSKFAGQSIFSFAYYASFDAQPRAVRAYNDNGRRLKKSSQDYALIARTQW